MVGLLAAAEEQVFEAFDDPNVVVVVVDPVGVGHDDYTSGQNRHQNGHHDREQHERRHQVHYGRDL